MNRESPSADFGVSVHDLNTEEAVARLLDLAIDIKASDLFFSSNENHVSIHVRRLGIYQHVTLLNAEQGKQCLAHMKALAGLDITERRRPLDGRWIRQRADIGKVDLRISTIPTLYGEDLALRILPYDRRLFAIDGLGLRISEYHLLLDFLNSPSGLVLVTGPTGAGKTTTLYACLNYLNNGARKINTIEDPIEYALPGVRQSQVNARANVDFPDLLRSVLRQGPDVIMIGEIRDPVTATTAVRAANSGHLVLATLHAAFSAGAVQSMLNLGVQARFLGGALRGIIAQRLVRTLCPACKTAVDASDFPAVFDEVKEWLASDEGRHLFAAGRCTGCHHTGYSGRTGVFEILPLTSALRDLIYSGKAPQKIRDHAVATGMLEYRHAALLKVARGETSAEEVVRVIPSEFLGLD